MTAEIVIMNKLAVALAADSAVTIQTPDGAKVYNSANKLFTASKVAPVGILIYGVPDINNIHIEVIIKEFREQLGRKRFGTLDGYVAAFFSFLHEKLPIDRQNKIGNFQYRLSLCIRLIYNRAIYLRGKGDSHAHDIQHYIQRARDNYRALAKRSGRAPSLRRASATSIASRYSKQAREWHKEVLSNLAHEHDLPALAPSLLRSIEATAIELILCDHSLPAATGLVIAGYGDADLMPSYYSFEIDGFLPFGIRCIATDHSAVTADNQCSIKAFAQKEMAEVFMEGIDRGYSTLIHSTLKDIFDRLPDAINAALKINASKRQLAALKKELAKTFTEFDTKMTKHRRDKYTFPVLNAVRFLDKSELAAMAESLVSITALKRRFTLDPDSVGGPIDLAVISKGDGFIWIKRKHYFDLSLNPSFVGRYLPPEKTSGGRRARKG